jgi:Tfp pilus assembly protein PilV
MTRTEQGFSLVEALVAALIIGVAVVPLLRLVPGIIGPGQISGDELRLGAAATRKSEELIHRMRASIAGVVSGAEACPDLPNCRIEWTVTIEQTSAITGVGSLRTLATVACQDSDVSGSCDAGEPRVRFDTKVTSRP